MSAVPLLSSRWLETKRRGLNRGTFMPPPSTRAPGPCFLFISCCRIQWAETLPPVPLWRHKRPFSTGAPRRSTAEGRGRGCDKEPIVRWGPGSEQGLASGDRSQPEPCGAAGGREGQRRAGACGRGARGPGVAGRQVQRPARHPVSQPTRKGGVLDETRVQPGPVQVKSPV